MDESVLRAMARWPDVPAVFGWLSLDRRGDWRIKGERILHKGLAEFIARNYNCDETGRWIFQNGPQRVYVRIEHLPFVLRVDGTGGSASLRTHLDAAIGHIETVWLHGDGDFVIAFDGGVGALCDRDLGSALDMLLDRRGRRVDDAGLESALIAARAGADTGLMLRLGRQDYPVRGLDAPDLAARFGFIADPRPAPGQPEC